MKNLAKSLMGLSLASVAGLVHADGLIDIGIAGLDVSVLGPEILDVSVGGTSILSVPTLLDTIGDILAGIPEPEVNMMIMLGLAAISFVVYRKNRA